MKLPDLQMLAHWLDPALVATLETRRRLKKEWHRRRKLATLQTLWLTLAVSLDTQRSSLHEILRLATGRLNIRFSVSVPLSVRLVHIFPLSALSWLYGELVSRLQTVCSHQRHRWHGLRLIAADKTTLALPEFPALFKRFGAHKGQHACEVFCTAHA
jgi:hypothetical protein